jgi:hypothetical protein
MPKRDLREPINSDGEFDEVMAEILNAGLVTYEVDGEPEEPAE